MKALAILAACLLLSLPAEAFVRVGGGPAGAYHPGGPAHGGAGPNWGGYRYGGRFNRGLNGGYGGYGGGIWLGDTYGAPTSEPVQASAPAEPEVVYQPVPYCPTPARPKTGPHIIFIGQKPAIHGPKIIYGTD